MVASSLVAEGDQLVVGHRPQLVALEDEVLHAQAGAPVLDQDRATTTRSSGSGRPAPRASGCRSSCRGSRALRGPPGPRSGSPGSGGRRRRPPPRRAPGGRLLRASEVNGIDEITWERLDPLRWPPLRHGDRHGGAVLDVDGHGRGLHADLPPCPTTCSAQRSHIMPGPYFGYSNSSIRLVTCLDLSRACRPPRCGSAPTPRSTATCP